MILCRDMSCVCVCCVWAAFEKAWQVLCVRFWRHVIVAIVPHREVKLLVLCDTAAQIRNDFLVQIQHEKAKLFENRAMTDYT